MEAEIFDDVKNWEQEHLVKWSLLKKETLSLFVERVIINY